MKKYDLNLTTSLFLGFLLVFFWLFLFYPVGLLPKGGMIIGTSSRPPRMALPRNEKRVMAQASGSVRRVVAAVVKIAMRKLFSNDSR